MAKKAGSKYVEQTGLFEGTATKVEETTPRGVAVGRIDPKHEDKAGAAVTAREAIDRRTQHARHVRTKDGLGNLLSDHLTGERSSAMPDAFSYRDMVGGINVSTGDAGIDLASWLGRRVRALRQTSSTPSARDLTRFLGDLNSRTDGTRPDARAAWHQTADGRHELVLAVTDNVSSDEAAWAVAGESLWDSTQRLVQQMARDTGAEDATRRAEIEEALATPGVAPHIAAILREQLDELDTPSPERATERAIASAAALETLDRLQGVGLEAEQTTAVARPLHVRAASQVTAALRKRNDLLAEETRRPGTLAKMTGMELGLMGAARDHALAMGGYAPITIPGHEGLVAMDSADAQAYLDTLPLDRQHSVLGFAAAAVTREWRNDLESRDRGAQSKERAADVVGRMEQARTDRYTAPAAGSRARR